MIVTCNIICYGNGRVSEKGASRDGNHVGKGIGGRKTWITFLIIDV